VEEALQSAKTELDIRVATRTAALEEQGQAEVAEILGWE
jgi:hypothetical protein